MTRTILGTLICLAVAFPMTLGSAVGAGQPASKFAAALGDLTALGKAEADADPDNPSDSDDTGWVTVLGTAIKTPNQKELAFDVALQCGLSTYTKASSKGGKKDTSNASGTIRVRVKIKDEDGTPELQ